MCARQQAISGTLVYIEIQNLDHFYYYYCVKMDCVQVCGQSKARAHSYLISSLSPPHFPRTPHFTQFLHLFLLCRIILWNKNASKLCLFPNLLHKSYFYQLFYTLISHYSNFDYLYCCFCSHHENLAQNSCTRFPCFKCVSPKISE